MFTEHGNSLVAVARLQNVMALGASDIERIVRLRGSSSTTRMAALTLEVAPEDVVNADGGCRRARDVQLRSWGSEFEEPRLRLTGAPTWPMLPASRSMRRRWRSNAIDMYAMRFSPRSTAAVVGASTSAIRQGAEYEWVSLASSLVTMTSGSSAVGC